MIKIAVGISFMLLATTPFALSADECVSHNINIELFSGNSALQHSLLARSGSGIWEENGHTPSTIKATFVGKHLLTDQIGRFLFEVEPGPMEYQLSFTMYELDPLDVVLIDEQVAQGALSLDDAVKQKNALPGYAEKTISLPVSYAPAFTTTETQQGFKITINTSCRRWSSDIASSLELNSPSDGIK